MDVPGENDEKVRITVMQLDVHDTKRRIERAYKSIRSGVEKLILSTLTMIAVSPLIWKWLGTL
jgi:hypothetical protein